MLEHGERARVNSSVFFERYNEIDIYVEDTSKEARKLYAKLFSRAMAGRIRIDRVFPLGPKSAVISACRRDQQVGGRRRVYVVDGDIDLCLCSNREPLIRLYRLPRYCIENFLIDATAAAAVVERESLEFDIFEVEARLGFGDWVQKNARPLRRLFVAFGVVKVLAPSIPTISIGYTKLVESDSGEVSALKIEHLIGRLRDAVDAQCGRGSFFHEYRRLTREHRMKGDEDFMFQFVSGKDFLLPLLKLRMNKVAKLSHSLPQLKLNLADVAPSRELVDFINFAQ